VQYAGIPWTSAERALHRLKERSSRVNPLRHLAKIQNVWSYGRRTAKAVRGYGIVYLHNRAASKVRDLSGGQMRRLEIARALLHRPRLLLLDEPTVGLDVKARADILNHVRRLVAEQGISVLWATHLFDEIGANDDLVVLHQGRVLAQGKVARVIADAGSSDINTAFMRLTGAAAPSGGQAS
jgi:ABC-2 type transport system ATP-binding protein